ncbi:hypothetical protein [Pedobacter sp. MR2016-19]|nr:hypothetical protein [Pedobacter sp. MR2016-19]
MLVKRKANYQKFEKEQAVGFNYSRILTKNIKFSTAYTSPQMMMNAP